MFCPKCGSKISDDARFCTECGLPLGKLSDNGDKKPGKAEGAEHASSTEPVETTPAEPNSAEPARADGESASSPAKSQQELEAAEVEGPADQDVSPSVELESQEVPVSETHVASAPATEPASSGHSQMFNFFMQKRQIGSRLVPQFAIIIAAFIAAAGIAYAAFMLYKNVIEPNLQQPTQQEQVAEKPKKKAKKKEEKKEETAEQPAQEQPAQQEQTPVDTTAQTNQAAHTAYQDVISQYREALTNGDYDNNSSRYPLVNDMVVSSTGMYSTGVTADNSFYLLIDLNGDGVDELLFSSATEWSEGHFVYAVYAYIDGQVNEICQGWERNTYALCQGGLLINHASGGWATNASVVLKYVSGSNFETVDQVDEEWDDSSHTVTTVRTKNGQEISRVTEPEASSEPEAANLFNAQKADYPEDTSVAWQPLN